MGSPWTRFKSDMELLRQITGVTPQANFHLRVEFDTGEDGVFDVSPLLDYPCYRRLKDERYFNLARIDRGTVVWPNDEDLAPEMLWEKSVKSRGRFQQSC